MAKTNLKASYWFLTFALFAFYVFCAYTVLDFVSWYTWYSTAVIWKPTLKVSLPVSLSKKYTYGCDTYGCVAQREFLWFRPLWYLYQIGAPFCLLIMMMGLLTEVFSIEMAVFVKCVGQSTQNWSKRMCEWCTFKCGPKKKETQRIVDVEVMDLQQAEQADRKKVSFETKHAIVATLVRTMYTTPMIILFFYSLWFTYKKVEPVEGKFPAIDNSTQILAMEPPAYHDVFRLLSFPFAMIALAACAFLGIGSISFLAVTSYDDYKEYFAQFRSFLKKMKDLEFLLDFIGTVTILVLGFGYPLFNVFSLASWIIERFNEDDKEGGDVICMQNPHFSEWIIARVILLIFLQIYYVPTVGYIACDRDDAVRNARKIATPNANGCVKESVQQSVPSPPATLRMSVARRNETQIEIGEIVVKTSSSTVPECTVSRQPETSAEFTVVPLFLNFRKQVE